VLIGECVTSQQRLHLVRFEQQAAVLEDSFELKETESVSSSSLGDGVLFASLGRSYFDSFGGGIDPGNGLRVECFSCSSFRVYEPSTLITLGGLTSGHFSTGRLTVENTVRLGGTFGVWAEPEIHAYGTRAIVSGESDLAILDASDPSAPTSTKRIQLYAPAYSLALDGRSAVVSLGGPGVQRVSLED
jgi:hypothetical protein